MLVDVSEVKVLRECPRKWGYSSRNFYHLRSRMAAPNLKFGVLFHEALHTLYIEGPEALDKVLEFSIKELEGDKTQQIVMAAMLSGYKEVLEADLERYNILDIEYGFSFKMLPDMKDAEIWEDILICGSIDMVAADHVEQKIYGFEHKTCASFRPEFYNMLDEQPRLYYMALDYYVAEYNKKHGVEYTNGGIYLNQVKKLQRKFEYLRGKPLVYSVEDCQKFTKSFMQSCRVIHTLQISKNKELPLPEPGFMKCQMCDFKSVCSLKGYESASLEEIIDEFSEELEVRDVDHLEEKSERVIEE